MYFYQNKLTIFFIIILNYKNHQKLNLLYLICFPVNSLSEEYYEIPVDVYSLSNKGLNLLTNLTFIYSWNLQF